MNHELHQLFDPESSTFTYMLVDLPTREAIVVDSVDRLIERDLVARAAAWTDGRATSSKRTRTPTTSPARGCCATRPARKAAAPFKCGISPADVQLAHGDTLRFGAGEEVHAIHTPGHTSGSTSYLWRNNVLTGDTLLIDGCGRTDFQSGDAGSLYDSVHERLFTLPRRHARVARARLPRQHRVDDRPREAAQRATRRPRPAGVRRADGKPQAAAAEDDRRGGAREPAARRFRTRPDEPPARRGF